MWHENTPIRQLGAVQVAFNYSINKLLESSEFLIKTNISRRLANTDEFISFLGRTY